MIPRLCFTIYWMIQNKSTPFRDEKIESRFFEALTQAMIAHDAPPELYDRFALEVPV